MWRRLKNLLTRKGRMPGTPVEHGQADRRDQVKTSASAVPAIVFRRYDQYSNLFEFNLEKLDVNLLRYPGGADADRDAALLLVFGCEEILGVAQVNEAYVCRKIGAAHDRVRQTAARSFDAVYAHAVRFNAQDIVGACVAGGDLERVSLEAGGDVRLTEAARRIVAEMAFDLNRGA